MTFAGFVDAITSGGANECEKLDSDVYSAPSVDEYGIRNNIVTAPAESVVRGMKRE